MKLKRIISALLLLAMLLSCLPFSALAVETGTPDVGDVPIPDNTEVMGTDNSTEPVTLADSEDANTQKFFYFSAETEDMLLAAPRKIRFSDGQTILDALLNAGIALDFTDFYLAAVENVDGNYTWLSAPNNRNLRDLPEAGGFFCITESKPGVIGAGWQTLIVEMSNYLDEAADVQQAAASAYRAAKAAYPRILDDKAKELATQLRSEIDAYKNGQKTQYDVTFSGNFSGCTITAESSFGKTFTADESGILSLPNGEYSFRIQRGNRSVYGGERSLIVNNQHQTVYGVPVLPEADWFADGTDGAEALAFSRTSGWNRPEDFVVGRISLTNDSPYAFSAVVTDTFTGGLYPCVTLRDDLTEAGISISAIYTTTAGEMLEKPLRNGAMDTALYDVLKRGAAGNRIVFRASKEAAGGYLLQEDLTLDLGRTPTLAAIQVEGASGTKPAAAEKFSDQTFTYTYKVLAEETSLKITPKGTADGYTILVDGKPLTNGSATVPLDESGEDQEIKVTVIGGEYRTEYTLVIQRGQGRRVTLVLMDEGMKAEMRNANGETLEPIVMAGNQYIYTLVSGETYTYRATRDTYYHVEETFTLQNMTTFTVSIPEAQLPSLDKLYISTSSNLPIKPVTMEPGFTSAAHTYSVVIPDDYGRIAVWADPAADASCSLRYRSVIDGTWQQAGELPLSTSNTGGKELTDALVSNSAYDNTLTFTASRVGTVTAAGTGMRTVTFSTDYVVQLKRSLSLKSLAVACGGSPVTLNYGDGKSGFTPAQKAYEITVPSAASYLDLTAAVRSGIPYGETDSGYLLFVNGEAATSGTAFHAALSGDAREETVTVTVQSRLDESVSTDYVITVKKADSLKASFQIAPEGAVFYIYETVSGNRLWPDSEGKYAFSTGFTYRYSLTKHGYVGQSGAIQLTAGENGEKLLDFGTMEKQADGKEQFQTGTQYKTDGTISLTLKPADANPAIKEELSAEWPDFRGSASNNAVTDAKIPFSAEDGTLYWSSGVGKGYSANAVSNPILVDNSLIVYAGAALVKIDKDTGAVLARSAMAGTSSFAINNPTYAEGVILVGLSDGRVQAFNADTLDSLWLYTDPLGGQPNCPITVSNGYAYTGFWNSEVEDASYVCLSLTDEDPKNTTESKAASWRYVQKGGFYWAGAYACEDYVLVGTDDGERGYRSSTARLLLLDPVSGKLLDAMSGFTGDIRCSICYDETTKAFYFTSKGGYFYSVKVQKNADGAWKLGSRRELALGGMSTSTPVVYKGRAYVGVSGKGQFTAYSGHNITVVDLGGAMSVVYFVETQGYPQTSGLLTTAYEETSAVYVYFFDNYTPGKLRVLRDSTGQDAPNYTTPESMDGKTYTTAYALFTPVSPEAQYAICSPIVDEYGTMYFKNDSGYLMAYGSAVKELKITGTPKTEYVENEKFDASGLKVMATYENGVKRDVTKLMWVTDEALTLKDKKVTLVYCKDQTMYHNQQNTADNTMESGVKTVTKSIDLPITVTGAAVEGEIDDLKWSFTAQSGKLAVTGDFNGRTLIAACYEENGRMIQVRTLTTEGSLTLNTSSAGIKLFLLDSGGKPVCPAVTVKETK